jgi:hypothetical protein
MSPAATVSADVEHVVREIFKMKLPRTRAEQVDVTEHAGHLVVRVTQPPAEPVAWRVHALGTRALTMQRADPTSATVLEGHPVEEWALPPADRPLPGAEDPRAAKLLAREARAVAEQLVQATHSARTQLQHVALDPEAEVSRLLGGVRALDAQSARSQLTGRIASGLGAFIDFRERLAAAEQLLSQHRELAHATSAAVAAQALAGSIVEIQLLRRRDPARAEHTVADVDLADAVREAADFRDAFRSAAVILAQSGAAAAARLQVETIGQALGHLKVELTRVRATALDLDPPLLAAVQTFSQATQTAVRVPTLAWMTPKDPFSPPSLVEG